MKSLRVKNYLLCLLLVILCNPQSCAEDYIKKMENIWGLIQKSPLAAGMVPSDVERIVGAPDNPDWNMIAIGEKHTYRVWVCVEKNRDKLKGWRDVTTAPVGFFGRVSFFLFVDDKLSVTTIIPILVGKEDNGLFSFAKIPIEGDVSKPVSPGLKN